MTKEEVVVDVKEMMKKVDAVIAETLLKYNDGKKRKPVDIFFIANVDLPEDYKGVKGRYFTPNIIVDASFFD